MQLARDKDEAGERRGTRERKGGFVCDVVALGAVDEVTVVVGEGGVVKERGDGSDGDGDGGVLVVVDEGGAVNDRGDGCDGDGDGWVAGENGGVCGGVMVSCDGSVGDAVVEDVSGGVDRFSERADP